MTIFKLYIIVQAICLMPILTFSQIPTIKAVGGEGRNVNWPKLKAEVEEEEKASGGGPGFFYNDCYQGVIPLRASSTLANQGKYNYNIKNLNDENPMTAWVEGKKDYGIGEFFEIKAFGVNVIYNGYQSSPKNWIENSRVKKFKVYRNNVPLCYLELTDEMGRQSFELPKQNDYDLRKEYTFKFEILEVYEGTKWQDVAISEIDFALCCVSESTTIESPFTMMSIANLKKGLAVYSINVETGELSNTEVSKIFKQRHLSMLQISCETKELELTSHHPLYIKDFGFSSINNYMKVNKIDRYEDLIDKVEFGVWDESKGGLYYEKLKKIKLVNGVFDTYAIGGLTHGNTFIANGFITKTY